MKRILLIVTFLITAGCHTIPQSNPTPTPSPSPVDPPPNIPEFRIESLTKENRKDFESTLHPAVRKVFEEANELTVTTSKGKFSVTEPLEKRRLLDSIYWDLANSFPLPTPWYGIACKETVPNVSTIHTDENLLTWTYSISMSYTCQWIDVRWGKNSSSHYFAAVDRLSKNTFLWLEKKYISQP